MTKKIYRKHLAFIDEYFICNMNATEAYMRVYHVESRNGAAASACRLMKMPKIKDEIQRRLDERAMSAAEVIDRISQMGRGSIEDCLTFVDGMKEPYFDLAKAKRLGVLHLIKKLTRDASGKVTIEMYDAKGALETMAKYHKLLTDRVEQDVSGEVEIVVRYDNAGDRSTESA